MILSWISLVPPAIVEAFVASIAPYPPGSYVRLADGRAGRVRAVGAGTLELTVVVDADGTAIAPSDEAVGLEDVAAAT